MYSLTVVEWCICLQLCSVKVLVFASMAVTIKFNQVQGLLDANTLRIEIYTNIDMYNQDAVLMLIRCPRRKLFSKKENMLTSVVPKQ